MERTRSRACTPHPRGVVVVLTAGHLRFTDENGKTQEVFAKPSESRWFPPFKHKVENLGSTSYNAVYIGIKNKHLNNEASLKARPSPIDQQDEETGGRGARGRDEVRFYYSIRCKRNSSVPHPTWRASAPACDWNPPSTIPTLCPWTAASRRWLRLSPARPGRFRPELQICLSRLLRVARTIVVFHRTLIGNS